MTQADQDLRIAVAAFAARPQVLVAVDFDGTSALRKTSAMRPPRDRPGARRISQFASSQRCFGVSRGFALGRRCGGIEAHGKGVHAFDGSAPRWRQSACPGQNLGLATGTQRQLRLDGLEMADAPRPLRPFGTVSSRFHVWLWLPLSRRKVQPANGPTTTTSSLASSSRIVAQ